MATQAALPTSDDLQTLLRPVLPSPGSPTGTSLSEELPGASIAGMLAAGSQLHVAIASGEQAQQPLEQPQAPLSDTPDVRRAAGQVGVGANNMEAAQVWLLLGCKEI